MSPLRDEDVISDPVIRRAMAEHRPADHITADRAAGRSGG
jgi:hypothetical protein